MATRRSERRAPLPPPLPSMNIQKCANCDGIFDSEVRATKAFVVKIVKDGQECPVKVKVWKALQELYLWKSDNQKEQDFPSSVALCEFCGLALAKLYSAFKLFDQLAVSHSYLNKFTKSTTDEHELGTDSDGEGLSSMPVKTELYSSEVEAPAPTYGRKKRRRREVESDKDDFDMTNDNDSITYEEPGMFDDEFDGDEPVRDLEPRSPRAPDQKEWLENTSSKNFLCQFCARGFDTPRTLQTHLLLSHDHGKKTKDYVCHCGKAYYYPYLLTNHQKVHSDERPVQCTLCPSRFKSTCSLRHHLIHVHTDRGYKCELCGKDYKEERSLREHLNITHKPARKIPFFTCKFDCGAKTPRKRSLLLHYRTCKKRPMVETQHEVAEAVQTTVEGSRGKSDETDLNGLPSRSPCPWDCGKKFKSESYMRKHAEEFCPKRSNAPIKRRIHKRRKPLKTIHVAESVNEEFEGSLPDQIMDESVADPTDEMDSLEQSTEEHEHHGNLPVYLQHVDDITEEYIETETITFHEAIELNDNFSAL